MLSSLSRLPASSKLILFSAFIAVILSWSGSLDNYSEHYLDDALLSGGVVYATARGINAAVSVLQGTEITPAVATFTVGQVLDPINDLIERFSGILLLALGSLALQKIMLEIFSHSGFSLLVTGIALLALICATVERFSPWLNTSLRLLVLSVLVRFALSLVVLASGAVDRVFLNEADNGRHAQMTRLEGELQALDSASPCAQGEQAGESCGFWDRAYRWVSPAAWADRFTGLGDRMDDYANNIISLLASFLAKTVLIPLLFLYTVIHAYRSALGRLLPGSAG